MDLNAFAIRKLVFPLMRIAKGNNTMDYIDDMQNNQYLPKKDMYDLQRDKLTKLLLHCVKYVPAYADYKGLIPDIEQDAFSALGKFPILTKQKVNHNTDNLICSNADKSTLTPNQSGGSSGEPVRFFIDRPTAEYSEAARWLGLSWWDINIGDKCLMVWGSPLELNKRENLIYNMKERFLKNIIFVPAYNLNPQSIQKYVDMINTQRPVYFYGYASALHLLSQLIINKNIKIKYKLKGIVSTSENLYDFQRKTIEKAFDCPVINEYGARDAGIIAYECPHGKMHISAENMIVEILDIDTNQPVEPGESGLVVITDLNNFSMPRLRYKLGDVAALSENICECGRTLPLIEKIEGREDDIFIALNGNYVHAVYFCNLARSYPSIMQFQIIQQSRQDILLRIIKSDTFKESEIQTYIDEIYKLMGPVNVKVEYTDTIEPTASGKIRYSKRDFPISV
ncbi:MAG TPA: phenylacetate--CoA ligase family protein [Thermoclostridium sp.]|nr:phenylacetate--CoA ligase family protein [Thermoclostridium sp.]